MWVVGKVKVNISQDGAATYRSSRPSEVSLIVSQRGLACNMSPLSRWSIVSGHQGFVWSQGEPTYQERFSPFWYLSIQSTERWIQSGLYTLKLLHSVPGWPFKSGELLFLPFCVHTSRKANQSWNGTGVSDLGSTGCLEAYPTRKWLPWHWDSYPTLLFKSISLNSLRHFLAIPYIPTHSPTCWEPDKDRARWGSPPPAQGQASHSSCSPRATQQALGEVSWMDGRLEKWIHKRMFWNPNTEMLWQFPCNYRRIYYGVLWLTLKNLASKDVS
jgi:hypothetical protein